MKENRTNTHNKEYTNGEITVYWRPSKCTHATTCYRELIEVFNPHKRPWVNMDGAPTQEIISVVNLCPTEALTYKWNKEKDQNNIDRNTTQEINVQIDTKVAEVKVIKDGPLIVKGNFKIIGVNGVELRTMKMASFCRCGQSKNMPFCDGTHRKVNFSSD